MLHVAILHTATFPGARLHARDPPTAIPEPSPRSYCLPTLRPTTAAEFSTTHERAGTALNTAVATMRRAWPAPNACTPTMLRHAAAASRGGMPLQLIPLLLALLGLRFVRPTSALHVLTVPFIGAKSENYDMLLPSGALLARCAGGSPSAQGATVACAVGWLARAPAGWLTGRLHVTCWPDLHSHAGLLHPHMLLM